MRQQQQQAVSLKALPALPAAAAAAAAVAVMPCCFNHPAPQVVMVCYSKIWTCPIPFFL